MTSIALWLTAISISSLFPLVISRLGGDEKYKRFSLAMSRILMTATAVAWFLSLFF